MIVPLMLIGMFQPVGVVDIHVFLEGLVLVKDDKTIFSEKSSIISENTTIFSEK